MVQITAYIIVKHIQIFPDRANRSPITAVQNSNKHLKIFAGFLGQFCIIYVIRTKCKRFMGLDLTDER